MRHGVLLLLPFLVACGPRSKQYATWETYGGSKANIHYTSLKKIDTANVMNLKVAWTYHTGDADKLSQMEVNPIIVHQTLYGVSPQLKLFAVDATTGKEKWVFDPAKDSQKTDHFFINACRGIAYYHGGEKDQRLFYTAGSMLYCLDALTGKPENSFGNAGRIDLHKQLGRGSDKLYVTSTTPGTIYKDLIIIGTRVSEEADAAPGYIRAYDVHSGALRWTFHTIPLPGEKGYKSWDDPQAYEHTGGVNSWSGFSLDEKRGILYAPTGSASPDFYGGKRLGDDLFANCVLAIDAATGKLIWHFQTVHHDLWDRDLPAPPALVTITRNGKKIDALAQITKTGFVFVLNRETGEPVYPIKETPVPAHSTLEGERPSLTQPIPALPEPFVRQRLSDSDLNHLVPDSSFQKIKNRLATIRTGNIFTPPSKEGSLIFPGFDGGGEWGGPAFDPQTGLLYVNASEVPWILTMIDATNNVEKTFDETNLTAGIRLYATYCKGCHGLDRKGSGDYPSLIGINKRYSKSQFIDLIGSGRRMMPAFKQLNSSEKNALASFILSLKDEQQETFHASLEQGDPYRHPHYASTGYKKFLTPEGYPAVKPPWGTLNAIDLNSGQLVWKDTLGDYPELKAKGIRSGTENYGGAVVTAGGLAFIAATSDSKIRAFNKRTGQLLWEASLPACGFATPAIYSVNGKQYIVIACGGGKLGKPSGDAYVAFSLPDEN